MTRSALLATLALTGASLAAPILVGKSAEGVSLGQTFARDGQSWLVATFMNELSLGDSTYVASLEDFQNPHLVHLDAKGKVRHVLELSRWEEGSTSAANDSNSISVSDVLTTGDAVWLTGRYSKVLKVGKLAAPTLPTRTNTPFVLKLDLDLTPVSLQTFAAPESSSLTPSRLRQSPTGEMWMTGSFTARRPMTVGSATLPPLYLGCPFVARLKSDGSFDTAASLFPVRYDSTATRQSSSSLADLRFLPTGEMLVAGSFSGWLPALGSDTAKRTSTSPFFARLRKDLSTAWITSSQRRDSTSGQSAPVNLQLGRDGALWAGISYRTNLVLDSARGFVFPTGTRGAALLKLDTATGRIDTGWNVYSDKALTLSGISLVGDSLWLHGSFTSRLSADLGAGSVTSTDTTNTDGWAARFTGSGLAGHRFLTGSGTGVVSRIFTGTEGQPVFLGTNVSSAKLGTDTIDVGTSTLGSFWVAGIDTATKDTSSSTGISASVSKTGFRLVSGGVLVQGAKVGSLAQWRGIDGRLLLSVTVPENRIVSRPRSGGLQLLRIEDEQGGHALLRLTEVQR